MTKKDFFVSKNLIWALTILNIVLTVCYTAALLLKWENAIDLMYLFCVTEFANWIIIMSDILHLKIYNKQFWIITMVIFPTLGQLIYLLRRDALIWRGDKSYINNYKSTK